MVAKFISSSIFAFISTNIYWLLTVTYTKPVKDVGEPGVISGFEAAKILIEKHGLDAYLNGMLVYFIVVLVCCLSISFFAEKAGKFKAIIFKSFLLSLAGAFVYYLLDFKVYIEDRVHHQSGFVGGYEAASEVGYLWLSISLIALSVLIFITMLAHAGVCRYLDASKLRAR